jgi:hypothetical protein
MNGNKILSLARMTNFATRAADRKLGFPEALYNKNLPATGRF